MAFNSLSNETSSDPLIVEINHAPPTEVRDESTASSNLARDRIAQSYLGLCGNLETQNRSRRRINWMAAQATGERVLDIGCSEGILGVLLAREGFQVTGIDVNQDALQYARDLLARENEFVAPRIKLVLGDMMTAELGPEPFDTVILGEVLEHLTKPGLMVRHALKMLRPGGRFVVTTPFGHFPHPDHRQTFVTSGLVEILREGCNPLSFTISDGYFLFVGTRSATPDWTGFDTDYLLKITEQEAVSQQKNLRGQLEIINQTNARLRQGNQKAMNDLDALRAARLELSARLESVVAADTARVLEMRYLKDSAEKAEQGLAVILGELQARRGELERFEERIGKANQETAQLQAKLQLRQREIDMLKAQSALLDQEKQALHEQLKESNGETAQGRLALAATQERLNKALEETAALRQREMALQADLDAALGRVQTRQEELKQALQQGREIAHALRSAQIELDAERNRTQALHETAEQVPLLQTQVAAAQQEIATLTRQRQADQAEARTAEQYRLELEKEQGRIKQLMRQLKTVQAEAKAAAEGQRVLHASVAERDEAVAQLSRELHRLGHEHELLVKAEYLSRNRVTEAERNLGFRIAARLRQFWLESGRVLARKLAQRSRRKWDPVVLTLDVTTPEPGPHPVRFSCATPEWIRCDAGKVTFSVPAGQSALLISKENARITQAPRKKQMRLERTEYYAIAAEVTLSGGDARLHLLEYQKDRFLQGRELALENGPLSTNWETHEEHRRLCVAIELRGEGELRLDGLTIKPSSEVPLAHSLILRRNAETHAQVRLTRRPRWRMIAVQPGETLRLYGKAHFEEATDMKAGFALARVEYLDEKGQRIGGPFSGIHFSRRVGHYHYLRCPAASDQSHELMRLTPPPQARTVRLGFQTWNVRHILFLTNTLELRRTQAGSAPPVGANSTAAASVAAPVDHASSSVTLPRSATRNEGRSARLKRECQLAGWTDCDPALDPQRPTIMAIMDEFTTNCFIPECNLIRPRPDNWEALADHYRPEMLFVESAWQGNGRTWQYRVGKYSNCPGPELSVMAEYARKRDIPLVFWNKEDPVHHIKFIEAARLAHTIFTTDACMIDSYTKKTGNSRVFALPFAAQPALHFPAPLTGRRKASCFAGSWYEGRHVERGEAMHYLLDAAQPFGLDIYDRNFGSGVFPFPPQFQEHVRGSLPYDKLCAEYGRYRVFLNVNSVFDSPTMFSRRVFELIACGTPVVSSYATGIEKVLGKDSVWLVHNAEETRQAITQLMGEESEWRRRALRGIRTVFAQHTYAHRLAEVQKHLGLSETKPVEPRTLLLAHAETVDDLRRLAEFHTEQSWRNFELVVLTDFLETAERILPVGVRAAHVPEQRERWLADELVGGNFMLFGFIDHRAYYGAHYLQDLINATRYAPDFDVVGKAQDEHEFTAARNLATMGCLIRASALQRIKAEDLMRLPHELPSGLRAYAADHEEFIPATH